ncbi:MAG: GMC family oxidoreductase [Deltaproteobacteria bacterium]|nr:GMC family oxidoreductase [Deltaproteobacteria bacterium]
MRRETLDEADFVIVGTGAGGATAARVLAAAGHSLVMLEEGARLRTSERPRDAAGALAQAMRDGGTQVAFGSAPMPLLQGRCVGGSTAINSGIIWRMPEDVVEDWTTRFGLGALVAPELTEPIYDRIEQELEITPTGEDVLGGNGHAMARGAQALGLPGQPMRRNAGRCRGSGECLQGCPGERRQSMDVSYVPRALADGARLHTHARVERVLIERGRAVGVRGVRLDPSTGRPRARFEVRARRGVILSAGVIHTPLILLRSRVAGPVGRHFQCHPGSALLGRFDEPIRMSFGATQGYEVPMRERGYKLESLSLPPEMLAARIPGTGAEWQERIASLDHYAQWAAQSRFEAQGRVRLGFGGAPWVRYEPSARDIEQLKEGLVWLARMMFEAGAREVYPGIHHVPEVLRGPDEVRLLEQAQISRADLHLMASHLFGTARAGADPVRSVVGPTLEAHSTRALYVMDASVFPTNLGVNPQHSIMAVVWRAAAQLAAQDSGRVARAG